MLLLPAPKSYISIVSVSGGLGSAEALRRTIERRGKENVAAVFADVKGSGATHYFSAAPIVDELLHERFGGEARDLYRFLWQLSAHFDLPIERLEYDLRTVYTVYADTRAFRLMVNDRFVHKCSEQKKRLAIKRYIQENYAPGEYEIVLGMGFDEEKRRADAQVWWREQLGWGVAVSAPNAEKPFAENCDTEAWCRKAGLDVGTSYAEGFEHRNCSGFCIAAGQTHFATLYNRYPERYLYAAYMERSIQRYIGKDVTILKDERYGFTKRISLYDFIPRIQAGDYPKLDWGGCGCFVGQMKMFQGAG